MIWHLKASLNPKLKPTLANLTTYSNGGSPHRSPRFSLPHRRAESSVIVLHVYLCFLSLQNCQLIIIFCMNFCPIISTKIDVKISIFSRNSRKFATKSKVMVIRRKVQICVKYRGRGFQEWQLQTVIIGGAIWCMQYVYCKAPFFAGVFFRAFAKISIRAGLIFALSHCGWFVPLSLVSQNAL